MATLEVSLGANIKKIVSQGYRLQAFRNRVGRYCMETARFEAEKWRQSGYWAQICCDVSGNYLYLKEKAIK